MANESTLQAEIIKKFWVMGIYCRKMRSESVRGFPDLLAIDRGRVVLIEVKHPNGRGKLSADQELEIALLRQHGAAVAVVDSLESALGIFS